VPQPGIRDEAHRTLSAVQPDAERYASRPTDLEFFQRSDLVVPELVSFLRTAHTTRLKGPGGRTSAVKG
jgi:hypothetical protein